MKRGDVYWYDPDPVVGSEQSGRRPGIVVSRDAINLGSPVILVVPVTTFRGQKLYPSDTPVSRGEGGLRSASVALGLHLRAIDRRRLGERLGAVSPTTLESVEKALALVLDLRIR